MPADNNGSKRGIRLIKLRQKVSGRLRTLSGARQFCAIEAAWPPPPSMARMGTLVQEQLIVEYYLK